VPEIPVRSMLNVRDELNKALPLVQNKALPMLERARTLQSLNQLLGEQRDHGGMSTSPIARIIVGILAEPEKIVAHTEGLKLMIERAGMPPAERAAMEALIAYVRRQAPGGIIGSEAEWGRKPLTPS
jgi:hypothetical protein